MKRYNSPMTAIQPIYHSSVLCSSDRVDSNINIHGGDKSSNASEAY